MPNTILYAWVKNVNNLRTNGSKTSGTLSPTLPNTIYTQPRGNGKLSVIQFSIHLLTTQLSTMKIVILNLLFATYTYYPQSLLLEPLKIN